MTVLRDAAALGQNLRKSSKLYSPFTMRRVSWAIHQANGLESFDRKKDSAREDARSNRHLFIPQQALLTCIILRYALVLGFASQRWTNLFLPNSNNNSGMRSVEKPEEMHVKSEDTGTVPYTYVVAVRGTVVYGIAVLYCTVVPYRYGWFVLEARKQCALAGVWDLKDRRFFRIRVLGLLLCACLGLVAASQCMPQRKEERRRQLACSL